MLNHGLCHQRAKDFTNLSDVKSFVRFNSKFYLYISIMFYYLL